MDEDEIESELLLPTPRRARLTSATLQDRRWYWNGVLVAFCVAYLIAAWDSNNLRLLAEKGKLTQANIYAKRISACSGIR